MIFLSLYIEYLNSVKKCQNIDNVTLHDMYVNQCGVTNFFNTKRNAHFLKIGYKVDLDMSLILLMKMVLNPLNGSMYKCKMKKLYFR
jgi:hypothetical protein